MGVLNRPDLFEYFAELFRGGLEKEFSSVWDELAGEAVGIHSVDRRIIFPLTRRQKHIYKSFDIPSPVQEIIMSGNASCTISNIMQYTLRY